MTEQIARLQEQIEKTRRILAEAEENHRQKPDEYSAQLLLLSTENYLSDLLRQLDLLHMQQDLDATP